MNKKFLMKVLFVILILGVLIYSVKDIVPQIIGEIKNTPLVVLVAIITASLVYHFFEGLITTRFSRLYNKDFSLWDGIESAFYVSFYRLSTLGSGAGIAMVYFLNKKKIKPHESTGMYMLEYVLHKISVVLFCFMWTLINFSAFKVYYSEYVYHIITGFVITFVISFFLVLICVSKRFHRICMKIIRFFDFKKKRVEKNDDIQHFFDDLIVATMEYKERKLFLLSQVGINMFKLTCWYFIPFFIAGSYGLGVIDSLSVTSMATVLAGVLPSPSGIGTFEYVFTLLFVKIIPKFRAVSVAVLYRFATYIVPAIIGGVGIVVSKVLKKQQNS